MKTVYHSFNKGTGIFYQQGDLFEVSGLKKTKKEARETFCKTWTHSWKTPAISTPNMFSKAYDRIKDFMTRIKLLDNNAKFYWYCSASFANNSNNPGGKMYALYSREVIPEQVEAETGRVVHEALIEPVVYRLEDYPYDEGKFIILPMFEEVLGVFDLNQTDHGVDEETCKSTSADELEKRKIEVEPQWKRNKAVRDAITQNVGNE